MADDPRQLSDDDEKLDSLVDVERIELRTNGELARETYDERTLTGIVLTLPSMAELKRVEKALKDRGAEGVRS